MGIIAGIYYFGPDRDAAGNVERMLATSGSQAARKRIAAAAEGCGAVGHVELAGSLRPSDVAHHDGIMIAVDGNLYDRQSHQSSAAFAMERYRADGPTFAKTLRGAFALAVVDTRARLAFLATDRIGTRRVHYRSDEHHFAFSSDARALNTIEGRATANIGAISSFLTMGYPFGSATFFDGIYWLPGGHTLVARDGRTDLDEYWRIDFGQTEDLSPEAFGDRFTDVFTRAIEDETRGADVVDLPLSGGLDSRCIAAALHHAGKRFRTYTIGSAGTDDPRIAKRVADALDVEHREYELIAKDSPAWADEGVHLSDGMMSAFDAHILHIATRLPDGGDLVLDGASMLDGFFCRFHVPFGKMMPRLLPRLELIRRICPGALFGADGQLDDRGLFAPDVRQLAAAKLDETMTELREQVFEGYTNGFDVLDDLTVTHRIRRFNMMGTHLLSAYRDVGLPFFHPDVVALVEKTPPQLRGADKPLLGPVITRLAPKLRDIPYERTGLVPEASSLRLFATYFARVAKRAAARHIPGYLGPRRGVSIDYPAWAATSPPLQDYIRSVLLVDRSMDRGLFNPDELREIVETGIRGDGFCFSILSRLISVELWHRRYIDTATPVEPTTTKAVTKTEDAPAVESRRTED